MQTARICLQNKRFAFLNEFTAPFTNKLDRIYEFIKLRIILLIMKD
ncbi:MAG: hypothetical protein JWP37_1009 [Mucilaginibacter sp.]|nr:hypothetical protein [Mucilaginibacter sp.]